MATVALKGIHADWLPLLKTPELSNILALVAATDHVPSIDRIFEWARLTPLKNIKVVILAQDPYPNNNAMGLAFSCKQAPSVVNIFKALIKSGLVEKQPKQYFLNKWAEQGVLLLNRSLTTQRGTPGAHRDLWFKYTQQLIHNIEKALDRELIFLLWGNDAKNISCKGRRLEYTHPSPMVRIRRFEDCPHFTEVKKIYPEIDWNVEPVEMTEQKVQQLGTPVEVMYTDGSCHPNNSSPTAKAGFAIVLQKAGKVIVGNLLKKDQPATNIRAEGMAILEALRYYKKNIQTGEVHLYTDSQFWMDMIHQYMPSWTDEKMQKKKNYDITKLLKKGWRVVGGNFRLIHVYSHGKNGVGGTQNGKYNEIADKAANYARTEVPEGEIRILDLSQFE